MRAYFGWLAVLFLLIALFAALFPFAAGRVEVAAFVVVVAWFLVSLVWSPVADYRDYRRRLRLAASAAMSPVPVDDGPLDYDGHTVPTLAEMRGYSFGDEMLAPVRERIA